MMPTPFPIFPWFRTVLFMIVRTGYTTQRGIDLLQSAVISRNHGTGKKSKIRDRPEYRKAKD
jgi:hypothetical protein